MTFNDIELATIYEALDAQREQLIDTRMHAEDRAAVEARGEDTSGYDEIDAQIEKISAIAMKIAAHLG